MEADLDATRFVGGMDLAMSKSEWNSPAVSDTGAN